MAKKDLEVILSPLYLFGSPKGTTLELFVKDYRDMIFTPLGGEKETLEAVAGFMSA